MTPTISHILTMIDRKADRESRRPTSMRVPRAYFEWARDEFENLPAAARHEGHAPPEDCIVIAGVDIFPED